MSQPFSMHIDLDIDQALKLFDPVRFDALLEELGIILHEEMNQAVVISKTVFVPVDTGFLQSKIQIIDSDTAALWILAGTVGCYYAVYVEFGTKFMNARPFWRPVVWEALFRIRERCDEAVMRWANV